MTTAAAPRLEWSGIEALLTRMCAEYDVAPDEAQQQAAEVLAGFADARLHSFVPILVEKQVRERLRHRRRRLSPELPALS